MTDTFKEYYENWFKPVLKPVDEMKIDFFINWGTFLCESTEKKSQWEKILKTKTDLNQFIISDWTIYIQWNRGANDN